jgi:hypothetical protein
MQQQYESWQQVSCTFVSQCPTLSLVDTLLASPLQIFLSYRVSFSHQPGSTALQSMNAQSVPMYNSMGNEGRTGSAAPMGGQMPQGMHPYPVQHMYQAPAHGSAGPMQVFGGLGFRV